MDLNAIREHLLDIGGVGRGDDVSGGSVPRATRQYAPLMSSATSRRSP